MKGDNQKMVLFMVRTEEREGVSAKSYDWDGRKGEVVRYWLHGIGNLDQLWFQ